MSPVDAACLAEIDHRLLTIGTSESENNWATRIGDVAFLRRLLREAEAERDVAIDCLHRTTDEREDVVILYDHEVKNREDAVAEARRQAIEDAAQAAIDAKLPSHYIWGHDAMEQFDFGKERAADAIRALVGKPPTEPST